MGLLEDGLALIATWGDEANAIEADLAEMQNKMPAFLFNWYQGFMMQRANTLDECKEAVEALLEA